jgi:hypothetical protein
VGGYDDSGKQPEDLLFFYKHLEQGGVLRKVLQMLSSSRFLNCPHNTVYTDIF